MPTDFVPAMESHQVMRFTQAKGEVLDVVEAFQTQETLMLDIRFESGKCLELRFDLRVRASGQIFDWVDGTQERGKTVRPERISLGRQASS